MKKKLAVCALSGLLLLQCFAACADGGGTAQQGVVPENHVCTAENLEDKGASTDLSNAYYSEEKNILTGFYNLYHPTVVKVEELDQEYPYRMFIMGWALTTCNPGWPGCDATFLLRGKNLNEWEIYCKENRLPESRSWWEKVDENGNAANLEKWAPVLHADDSKWYDNWHAGDASVVYRNGTFYLAYSSYNFDLDGIQGGMTGDTDGDLSCIMGATSKDGINWTKSEAPILVWEEELGKREPVTNNGIDFQGKPFYGLYHRPSIIWDEEDNKWKMWFDYMVNDKMSMGYAENEGDFLNPDDWVAICKDDEPALLNFTNPEVKKIGDKYLAYGDPSVDFYSINDDRIQPKGTDPLERGWMTRQLVEAQSTDGIEWTVTGYIPPDSDHPASHVPAMYIEDDHLFLYYATQIGYTKSGGDVSKYDEKYDALRVKRRCVNEITWRV